ncbi:MAG: hypothetical protein ACXWCZ_05715 [Flavisolibacter sp.]
MSPYKLSLTEKIILALVVIVIATGFALFFFNIPLFNQYVIEDGLVEWLTVAGLFFACLVCFSRFFKLFGKRSWWFLTVCFLLGAFLFFVSGEEISWGMRILNIKPSEFFEKNNAQAETNFHNLVVNGVKINKLVFSLIISVVFGIYLVVVPLLFEKNKNVRNFLNYSAVPIPRLYQVISFISLFIVVSLMRHDKNPELLECGAALLFFLIVRYPKNESIFDKNEKFLAKDHSTSIS